MNHIRYENLRGKFYTGTISEIEELELFEIINNDKALLNDFRTFDRIFEVPKNSQNEISLGILRKAAIGNNTRTSKIKKTLMSTSKYAAVFIVSFITFLTANHLIKNSKAKYMAGYFETVVPKGEKSQLNLPDGTTIWLNSESRLRYSSDFNREVELTGEAFFKIAKNKSIPFKVKTSEYTVEATGTEFNVMAYEDFHHIETSLVEGSVNIEKNVDGQFKKVCTLTPGQKITYDIEQGDFKIGGFDKEQKTAWKDNQFVFEDISFDELAKRLERWYDVSIVFADPELSKIKYRGKFKNKETIFQVLDIIKLTTKIEYKLNERELTIEKR